MAPRCGGASMARTEDDLYKVLAELQASRSIHFHRTLVRRMQSSKFRATEQLCLPSWFIKEHGDKFEEWVVFRTFSCKKPWRIRLSVSKTPSGSPTVKFVGGLRQFASDNGLKEGDSLVFVLNVDATSEFQVHIIRTSARKVNTSDSDSKLELNLRSGGGDRNYGLRERGADHLVVGKKKKVESDSRPQQIIDLGDSSGSESESDHGNGDAASERDCSDCKSSTCKQGVVSFRRRLMDYQSYDPRRRMEIPVSFVKTHINLLRQIRDTVQLQGVRMESPVRTVTCFWANSVKSSSFIDQLIHIRSSSVGGMAPGCGATSMASRLNRTGDDDLSKVLAELQASASIYFHKTLVRRSYRRFSQCVKLALPRCFIEEHGDKFEQRVILRTLSSTKLWRVRLSVETQARTGSPIVKFAGGWSKFAAANRLKEGDSLIFALNADARSEFRVYIFRGVTGMPGSSHHSHTLGRSKLRRLAGVGNMTRDDLLIGEKNAEKTQKNLGDSSSGLESNFVQASKIITSRQRKGVSPQSGANLKPSFHRQLVAYAYKYPLHRMEVPAQFLKAHGMPEQLQDVVELQGVHQESPVRTVACRWIRQREKTIQRLYFTAGWSEFAKENGLKVGQELQFTLTSESFFVVRVVV